MPQGRGNGHVSPHATSRQSTSAARATFPPPQPHFSTHACHTTMSSVGHWVMHMSGPMQPAMSVMQTEYWSTQSVSEAHNPQSVHVGSLLHVVLVVPTLTLSETSVVPELPSLVTGTVVDVPGSEVISVCDDIVVMPSVVVAPTSWHSPSTHAHPPAHTSPG
jgi:hypothetical protein